MVCCTLLLCRHAHEEQAAVVQELQDSIAELTQAIQDRNTTQATLQEQIHGLKEQIAQVGNDMSETHVAIEAQKQDNDLVRSQIVENPDQVKLELEQKTETLQREKGRITTSYKYKHKYNQHWLITSHVVFPKCPCFDVSTV